jgi:hypothetical protein
MRQEARRVRGPVLSTVDLRQADRDLRTGDGAIWETWLAYQRGSEELQT